MRLREFITEKAKMAFKPRSYEVEIPEDIDWEIKNTMRELGMSEREIRQALAIRNINT